MWQRARATRLHGTVECVAGLDWITWITMSPRRAYQRKWEKMRAQTTTHGTVVGRGHTKHYSTRIADTTTYIMRRDEAFDCVSFINGPLLKLKDTRAMVFSVVFLSPSPVNFFTACAIHRRISMRMLMEIAATFTRPSHMLDLGSICNLCVICVTDR